jgi:hypothetical protein
LLWHLAFCWLLVLSVGRVCKISPLKVLKYSLFCQGWIYWHSQSACITWFISVKEQACVILRSRRLSWFLGSSQNCELWLSSSSCVSRLLSALLCVCIHGATLLPLNGFSWNLIFEYLSKIFQNDPSDIKIWLRVLGTVHEELCSFMKSYWIRLGMRNVSYKSCSKTQNIFFIKELFFFFKFFYL